jgi:hypothetical protein
MTSEEKVSDDNLTAAVKAMEDLVDEAVQVYELDKEKTNVIDDLVNKGLKREMGCVLLLNQELPPEIAFTPTQASRKKFAFKAIFDVPVEEPYEIKI